MATSTIKIEFDHDTKMATLSVEDAEGDLKVISWRKNKLYNARVRKEAKKSNAPILCTEALTEALRASTIAESRWAKACIESEGDDQWNPYAANELLGLDNVLSDLLAQVKDGNDD